MSSSNHLQTPDFPLHASGDADGPSHRQAHEIGCGALVIRTTENGKSVCLKLDRIGKEYIHHYLLTLEPKTSEDMRIDYVDPEEVLFDCFATLDFELGEACEGEPKAGDAFENKDGHFIKVKDDPKAQKLFSFIDPTTGLVRIRQERNLKAVHPDWKARAKIKDEILDLADLLTRFAEAL